LTQQTVDRVQFERIARNLLATKPLKRDDVKVSNKKPEKLIPRRSRVSYNGSISKQFLG
jgi:hypothetical protein